jgi:hypothetical protein
MRNIQKLVTRSNLAPRPPLRRVLNAEVLARTTINVHPGAYPMMLLHEVSETLSRPELRIWLTVHECNRRCAANYAAIYGIMEVPEAARTEALNNLEYPSLWW